MKWTIDEQDFLWRKAETSDLNGVLSLLQQAGRWLQTKNTTQWDYYVTDLQGNTAEVKDSIDNHHTYVLESDGQAIASITLEDSPSEWDFSIWGEEAGEAPAFYLHRMVVHRDYAGKEIGGRMIEWAREVAKEKEKKCIRFDCLASNSGLNHYYQKRYRRVGIANVYGQHSKYEISL
ncbi:GNAT family N-acetyltransferase [Sediminibacillus dalangtanensis]|uniref:GNAT family N-acetyltransferase n=1 Tax=Sediminibacillus dalangtanensis TaxID=2729421 RepID=A0ABX7VUR2_9BACI|nr:GNAT family N-acetyltransferase [Sediminibacillus dalangtanensis]QTN00702.1 GNAT family N-acetyltransferase [Sediminibacillus dalangtanensis]